MVLKRIIEFEKPQEGVRHVRASRSRDNAPLPPNINIYSLVDCSTKDPEDFYFRSRFMSEIKIYSTSEILPRNSRRSLSVAEGFRGSLTQDDASSSYGDLLNNAFRRSINSCCSFLNNPSDNVSSDSSVFSMLTNVSPIPNDPFNKINQDKLCGQSPVLSSSFNFQKIPMSSDDKSDIIKKFYEIKNRKSSQIESNDHKGKELVKEKKEIKLILNDSNEKFADTECSCNLPKPKMNLPPSIAYFNDNNNNNNDLLKDNMHVQIS